MIYDAFPFFNELDLLELRLKTLESVVDRFILVEATRTHTGHPKPLFFQENKSRFSAFLNRIEHIVVDDYPPFETAWTYENHQRNCIVRGLSNAKPDDWILVSDLDEIPNPSMIEKCAQRPGRYRFNQKFYAYYINWRCFDFPRWHGTLMLQVADFMHGLDTLSFPYTDRVQKAVNHGTTATKWRRASTDIGWTEILHGGWHFTSLGGADAIAQKAIAFAHTECGTTDNTNTELIRNRLERLEGIFHKRLAVCRINSSFPQPIQSNPKDYIQLILPASYGRMLRDWIRFAPRRFFQETIERVRPLFPASIRPCLARLRGLTGL